MTESGRTLRAKVLHIPGCILAASDFDARTAKQLMTGIATLRSRWNTMSRSDRYFSSFSTRLHSGLTLLKTITRLIVPISEFVAPDFIDIAGKVIEALASDSGGAIP